MDVKELLAAVTEHLSVSRAFGTAYEKDGSLIIPVAFVAGGGGGGGADDPRAQGVRRQHDADEDEAFDQSEEVPHPPPRRGSGGGFGGVVMPIGVYVVKDDSVRWVPAFNVTFIALAALGLARVLVRPSSKRRRRPH